MYTWKESENRWFPSRRVSCDTYAKMFRFSYQKKKRNTRAKENLNRIMYFVITYKSSIDIQRSNDDKHRNYTIIQRLCYHPVNPLNSH